MERLHNIIKKYKALTFNAKLFIVLIIVLLIGIIIRWGTIKKDIAKGFNFLYGAEQSTTDTTNIQK